MKVHFFYKVLSLSTAILFSVALMWKASPIEALSIWDKGHNTSHASENIELRELRAITNTVYLPIIDNDSNNGFDTYQDPVYKYVLKYPRNWVAVATPKDGTGGVATFIEPNRHIRIEIGIAQYRKPDSVNLSTWVRPDVDLVKQLRNQKEVPLKHGYGLLETYEIKNSTRTIIYVPFDDNVVFAQVTPHDKDSLNILLEMLNSIIYRNTTNISTVSPSLYPLNTEVAVQDSTTQQVQFILPFSGKAQITQTGDNGVSHNCEGDWVGDCQALDFDVSINGMDGRVYAAEEGEIIYSNWDASYGNLIKIRHSNNMVSWYGHLSTRFVYESNFVRRGQILGLEGDTGCIGPPYHCGPHLHFMVKEGSLTSSLPVNISTGLLPGIEFTPCTTDINCGWGYGAPSLYVGADKTSWSQVFGHSASSLDDEPINVSTIKSLWVPERWAINLYPVTNFGGTPAMYYGPTNANLNVAVHSIAVFYNNQCISGQVTASDACPVPTSTPGNPTHTNTPIPPSSNVEIININSPGTVNPSQSFIPEVTIRLLNGQQLLESRGDMLRHYSGTNYSTFPHIGVVGAINSGQTYTFRFYNDYPFVAPGSNGSYESIWRIWADGQWIGPEIPIRFTVGTTNNNNAPGAPMLRSPHDWAEVRSEQAPELCWESVADPDGDAIEYWAEVYESANGDNSGWITGTCWRPNNLNGKYAGYKWHVKAKDSRGGESGWSVDWHFTLSPPPNDPIRPTSTPQPTPVTSVVTGPWWDSTYAFRRLLPITANETLPAGVVIKIDTLDLGALVAQGKIRSDYNDVRIVRRLSDTSWQEVARRVYSGWDIEFQLLTTIAPGTDNSYYIYYGNSSAGAAPTFTQPISGWWVEYYNDKWWTSWVRTVQFDQAMNFDNVCSDPIDHDGRTGSGFDDSELYRGRLYLPTTGVWTFRTYTNDGYALWIDGQQIGRNNDGSASEWRVIGSRELKAGWHTFEAGNSFVNCGAWKLAMEGPTYSNQIIPREYYQRQWGNIRSGFTPASEEPLAPPTPTFTPTPAPPTSTPTPIPPTPTPDPLTFCPPKAATAQWSWVPGGMVDVAAGSDCEVWGISDTNRVHRWNRTEWVFVESPAGRTIKQLAVGGPAHILARDTTNSLWRWTGTGWATLAGQMQRIDIGLDGEIWGYSNPGIYRWNGSSWEHKANSSWLVDLVVGDATHIWVLTSNGPTIYNFYKWNVTEGRLNDTGITGFREVTANGQWLCGTTSVGEVVCSDNPQDSSNGWTSYPAPSSQVRQVAYGIGGNLWSVETNNTTRRWLTSVIPPTPTDTPAPPTPTDTPVPTNTPIPGTSIHVKLRFQGRNNQSSTLNDVPIKVQILDTAGTNTLYESTQWESVTPDLAHDWGTASIDVTDSGLAAGSTYQLFVQGAMHLVKRVLITYAPEMTIDLTDATVKSLEERFVNKSEKSVINADEGTELSKR